jgi:hypothetical protein
MSISHFLEELELMFSLRSIGTCVLFILLSILCGHAQIALDQMSKPNCSDTSGSGTAQSCTINGFTPGTNSAIIYTTTTTNSGTSLTLAVNSLGAKNIAIPGSSGWTATLTAGAIPANKPLLLLYDGTNWNVQQTGTQSSTGGGGGGGSGNFTNIGSAVTIVGCTWSAPVCTVGTLVNELKITGIPSTYVDIKITVMAQDNQGSGPNGMMLAINGDTTGDDYDMAGIWVDTSNGSMQRIQQTAQPYSNNYCGLTSDNSSDADTNVYSRNVLWLYGYASSFNPKIVSCDATAFLPNNTDPRYWRLDDTWRSGAAINEIDLFSSNSSSFAPGTYILIQATN